MAMMQVFQLFPSAPRFGPVYHFPEHFLPPMFPLFLVAPAAAVGALWANGEPRPGLRSSLKLGPSFVAASHASNRLWSALLVSPWADNGFFGGANPCSAFLESSKKAPSVGWDLPSLLALLAGWILPFAAAWLALLCGRWLRTVIG